MANKFYYLTGSALSSFGDSCQQIAMMWLIYHLTGNALSIGLMIAIYYLPSIALTPFLSVLVDQRDSKSLVILTDSSRFFLIGILTLVFALGFRSVYLLYFLQVISAISYTIYKPASSSFIKETFKKRDLAFVISKSSSFNELASIIGMAVAGLLLTMVSPVVCFGINDLTFLFPVVLFSFIRRLKKKTHLPSHIHYFTRIKEGFTFIKEDKGLSCLIFLSILNSIAIQMSATLFLPLAVKLKGGSALYSTFEISFSAGSILAGFLVTYLMTKWNWRIVLFTMIGMMGTALLMGMNNRITIIISLIFLFGYFTLTHLITTQTLIQLNTPVNMIGRVTGLRTIIASTVKIASALTTGFLINHIQIRGILFLFFLVILACLFTVKRIKGISFSQLNS